MSPRPLTRRTRGASELKVARCAGVTGVGEEAARESGAVAVDAADGGTKERVRCVLSDGHVNRCHYRNQGQAEGAMRRLCVLFRPRRRERAAGCWPSSNGDLIANGLGWSPCRTTLE
jgi:hypothetical protein